MITQKTSHFQYSIHHHFSTVKYVAKSLCHYHKVWHPTKARVMLLLIYSQTWHCSCLFNQLQFHWVQENAIMTYLHPYAFHSKPALSLSTKCLVNKVNNCIFFSSSGFRPYSSNVNGLGPLWRLGIGHV